MKSTAKKAIASTRGIPSLNFIVFSKVQLPSNYIPLFGVDCHELNARIRQGRDEGDRMSLPVQLGMALVAFREDRRQLGDYRKANVIELKTAFALNRNA